MSTRSVSPRKSEPFDPDSKHVRHTRIGVWDYYERASSSLSLPRFDEALTAFPFVFRAIKTLVFLSCNTLVLYMVVSFTKSLLPAATLYYSSQVLQVIQDSINTGKVERSALFHVLTGRVACGLVEHVVDLIKDWISVRITSNMRSYYAIHTLNARIRLDVPTYEDPAIRGQLTSILQGQSSAWAGIKAIIGIVSTIVQLITQLFVLIRVLKDQPDGMILALTSLAEPILTWMGRSSLWSGGVWAATCRNQDYLRMQGFISLLDEKYRKELVAGNLQGYVSSGFHAVQERIGKDSLSFPEARNQLHHQKQAFSFLSFLSAPLQVLPQVIVALRALQSPHSIPVSLASLTLIQETASSFSFPLFLLFHKTSSMTESFASIRRLYELANIKNQIVDGTVPYPENKQSIWQGIAIEFRNVSFKYPGSDKYAIQNVSFKIERGQLCVLVGTNGSGKSTILKLITRLYDPTEGVILVDGYDIKTLKLTDLRRCISVLFQDYTHFPLSVQENIAMGDPEHAEDEDRIRQAAELGGATQIIEDLPEGFSTILSRPTSVRDYYSGLPEGTRNLFGKKVDYSAVKGRIRQSHDIELSGGQLQRLAVSRTFMKSLGTDADVGLLLFDEPSASLDPAAEHDLFERLHRLRGNKTMIFSSHRYGHLTRHADQILYMEGSTVMELGTHEELLKSKGGYSKIFNIQAAHFK